jgi:UDP-2,4-diacetamido-2,4,6-trideoxy-beta-L-altropyranose hydrolase
MLRPPYSAAFLRPDGAIQSGMGHLFRCLHLAAALRRHFDVTVLIDEVPASFLAVLDSHGVGWRRQADEDESIAQQIVVFDGYRFCAADFTKAREKGNLVVVIDDLASGYFDCDLVISHGPQNRRQDYKAAKDCRFLLGCEYALIDACFYAQAYVFRPTARRFFVNFGGSDPRDLTSFAAEALAGNDFELDLVVGAGYRHIDALQRFVSPRVRIYRDLRQTEVATMMTQCDAAIASGGTTSLELAAAGVPSLLFAFADNHMRPCIAFEQQKLASFGGVISDQTRDSFRSAVEVFRAAEATRRAIHIETRRLFRESGAPRVASEIAALAASRRIGTRSVEAVPHVTLEPFASMHLARTRRWITDRSVAEPFLYSGKVTESSHRNWFARVKVDRSQCLFAVRDSAGTHVGNVGFKNLDPVTRSGETWIYLAPECQGRGLGSAAIREAVSAGFGQLRLQRIYLHVSPNNAAARRIYEKAGFHLSEAAARVIEFNGEAVQVDRMEIVETNAGTARPGLQRASGTRVAMMQPMFLPWLGYFELMDAVDVFVFLDDFQFSRQGWGHRNRLFLSPGRPGIVSLPIRHPDNLAATFLDVTPAADQRWYDKLARSLAQSYGRSAKFAETWAAIGSKIRATGGTLAEYEIRLIEMMADRLGIRSQLRRSSEFAIMGLGRSERLVAILDAVGAGAYYAAHGSIDYMRDDGVFPLAHLPVFFQEFVPVPYRQSGASEFVPRLSALDALFNLSPSEAREAMYGTRRWLPWDEATRIESSGSFEKAPAAAAIVPPVLTAK